MITSRSPNRSKARAWRCSSHSSAICSSSSKCSLLSVASKPSDSARITSPRRAERRSISSLISFSVLMSIQTPRAGRIFLGIPELVEPVLVDPEVVGELVEDRDPDLLLEVAGVRKCLHERLSEDRDLVRQVLGGLPEPKQVGVAGRLLLDDHGDVFERLRELRRQFVQRPPHMLLEPHAPDRLRLPPGRAGLRRRLPSLEPPGLTGSCRALCLPAVRPQERVR